jgi:hypothetical protein
VILVFYACLAVGLALLVQDLRGRFAASPDRVRWWRRIGIVAAAGPGLGPCLAGLTGRLEVTWPFPLIAIGYLIAFLIFTTGVLELAGDRASARLRRVGYVGLLVLGALPSWVLLVLAPAVLVAGVALARPTPLPSRASDTASR